MSVVSLYVCICVVWSDAAPRRQFCSMPLGMISALTSFTCFRDFLIMGWGFSSSSENALVRGSKSRPDDAIENAANQRNGFNDNWPWSHYVPIVPSSIIINWYNTLFPINKYYLFYLDVLAVLTWYIFLFVMSNGFSYCDLHNTHWSRLAIVAGWWCQGSCSRRARASARAWWRAPAGRAPGPRQRRTPSCQDAPRPNPLRACHSRTGTRLSPRTETCVSNVTRRALPVTQRQT